MPIALQVADRALQRPRRLGGGEHGEDLDIGFVQCCVGGDGGERQVFCDGLAPTPAGIRQDA